MNTRVENKTVTAVLIALLILFWSTVASAFKLVLGELSYINMLLYSSAFSTLFIMLYVMLSGRTKKLLSPGRNVYKSLLVGILNPFIYYNVLFKAYSILPAQEAQPLNYTWPIVLALFSVIFLKERMSIFTVMGIILAFAGVMVISTRGNPASYRFSDPLGDFLAIGSSVIWAFYWIINVRRSSDKDIHLFYCFLSGFLLILLQSIIMGEISHISMKSALLCAYIGAFEMGITFILWIKILGRVKNRGSVILSTYIIPFLSLIFIYFVVGEKIHMYSVLGLTLIIAGIITDYTGKSIRKIRRNR